MAAFSDPRVGTPARRIRVPQNAWLQVVVVLLFLACYFTTSPDSIGDTVRWAGDAVGHAQGIETRFWDFGHLLWRPWAYVGLSLTGHWYERLFGDTPNQAAVRFLIQTNAVCTVLVLLVLLSILRKVANGWIAVAVVFALDCSTAFINYSHSGAPYIPGLLFATVTLWFLTLAVERPAKAPRWTFLAGVSFAISCGLWFPYAFSGLGMLALLYFWPSADSDKTNKVRTSRSHLVLVFLCSLAASALLLFLGGAAAKGIGSLGQLSQWIRESDNGLRQSRNAMRAVTGLPRSVWNFGSDTVLLKRWLWSDRFNPVSIHQIWAFRLGGKLVAFYLGIGASLWVLWKERRSALFMLVAAGLPVLWFAVALFEPSATERFFPVFPFAFLAFAIVLDAARRHPVGGACLAVLLGSMVLLNLAASWNSTVGDRLLRTHQRIDALNHSVQPGALVLVVTFEDDLYRLPILNPLNPAVSISRFQVNDTVELASQRTAKWRAEFAGRTLEQWAANRELWVSERLLAPRPERQWKWVEGDDRRVRWSDLPAMFTALQFDSRVLPGGDGFLRVARSEANRRLLASLVQPK